jgi:hypothetical protein
MNKVRFVLHESQVGQFCSRVEDAPQDDPVCLPIMRVNLVVRLWRRGNVSRCRRLRIHTKPKCIIKKRLLLTGFQLDRQKTIREVGCHSFPRKSRRAACAVKGSLRRKERALDCGRPPLHNLSAMKEWALRNSDSCADSRWLTAFRVLQSSELGADNENEG